MSIAGHKCCSVRFTLLEIHSLAVGTDSDLPNYYLTYQLICTYSKASVDRDFCGRCFSRTDPARAVSICSFPVFFELFFK